MFNPDINNLSGYLVEWTEAAIERSMLAADSKLHWKKSDIRHWDEYEFSSTIPHRGEDIVQSRPPYKYSVITRRSESRMLLLSLNREIIDDLIDNHLINSFTPPLKRVAINVDALVKEVTIHPDTYALSFVHARVPAFGASLRSISFYGDDLGEASLFREHMNLMVCFTCGLRLSVGGPEIVRLSGDGGISFHPLNAHRLHQVEAALGFLRKHSFFKTSWSKVADDEDSKSRDRSP